MAHLPLRSKRALTSRTLTSRALTSRASTWYLGERLTIDELNRSTASTRKRELKGPSFPPRFGGWNIIYYLCRVAYVQLARQISPSPTFSSPPDYPMISLSTLRFSVCACTPISIHHTARDRSQLVKILISVIQISLVICKSQCNMQILKFKILSKL